MEQKVKLHDKDKATNDAWFFAVYWAITEYQRLLISSSEDTVHKFSSILTSSLRDEHTETIEFELSCQLMLVADSIDKPSIKWKVWKTFSELQAFDDELRVSFGAHMMQIMFPRERKRDSLLVGMRKKSLQVLKQQQLALYIEQVGRFVSVVCIYLTMDAFMQLFQIPEILVEPALLAKVKHFLGFNCFFEIMVPSSSESNVTKNESSDAPVIVDPFSSESHALLFADSAESNRVQAAIEPVGIDSDALSISTQYPSTRIANMPPATLLRKISAAWEDENNEFVEIIPETDPTAARKLHKKIIQAVRELVSNDEERVQGFRDQTKDFGRGKTSATEFCAFLLGAFGAQECCKLIQKMGRLLPDEVKRDELMQARAAVWRRTHRRHRRRSKQFSESVLSQRNGANAGLSVMRPTYDSLGTKKGNSESVHNTQRLKRNSMIERPRSVVDCELHSHSAVASSVPHAGLAYPRRHLDQQALFSTILGETQPRKEGNPAENESTSDSNDILSNELSAHSNDTRSTRVRIPSNLGNSNMSFLSEDCEDTSTEDDEKSNRAHLFRRSHRIRHHEESGIAGCSTDAVDALFSTEEMTQIRPLETSAPNEERGQEFCEEENDHSRIRPRYRRASRRFDAEAKLELARDEENPVLARLKKQGAVNFMMQRC
ncbi:hypothetical protein PsorP6_003821 [Peronosclerospora sorghi]|uniref:Uncharacterized protein n=1 Tax=Peronosclerospora sorghi TaxID=230839 RepID=A0ACC0VJB4_9STRA|nr:hypothetical protein PsorP6_003821 [Peronosclerospora sorghi]